MKSLHIKNRISSLLPYETYDPNSQLFGNKTSAGFVIETLPLCGNSEDMQREISGLFQVVFPEGGAVQVMLWADPKIGNKLQIWEENRNNQTETLKTLANRRTGFLSNLNWEENVIARDFRCIISYSEKSNLRNPIERNKLNYLSDKIIATLQTLGLPAWRWDANDLIKTLNGIININKDIQVANLEWNPFELISEQIPSPDIAWELTDDAININDIQLKTYSVRRSPEYWALSAMSELIGSLMKDSLRVNCPFLIHYGLWILPKQEAAKTKLLTKATYVDKQAKSPIGKLLPFLRDEAEEYSFVREQLTKGERIVLSNLSLGLFSSSINKQEQVLLNLFRSNQWELSPVKYTHLLQFLSMLPMSWGEACYEDLKIFRRTKTTLSCESSNMLPIQAEWKGTKTPGVILLGRRGQIFYWSPFDNNAGNYNTAVVGRSGAGKSVFMQEVMTSILGLGGRVFVLDVGRSFEKTCKLLDGQFIEFSNKIPLCLNPFSTIQDIETLGLLKPIFSMMAAPIKGTDDLENALIEQAINAAWELKQTEASITDVADWLLKQEEKKAKNLGQMLFPYTKSGIYGKFFNGPSNVNFSNQLVVVELEELKERKDLQSVVVQMLIIQISNQMLLGNRQTKFAIVFDEAWDLLRGKQAGEFIETLARRLRKYAGSLIVGTQTVNDFFATPGAKAVYDNSDWMCFLSQKPESIEILKREGKIALTPHMEELLKSVKTKQGEYAEIMVYGPSGFAIGRLVLDPFSQLLYSTKAEEYSAIQNLQKQGLSLTEAIDLIIESRQAC